MLSGTLHVQVSCNNVKAERLETDPRPSMYSPGLCELQNVFIPESQLVMCKAVSEQTSLLSCSLRQWWIVHVSGGWPM